MKYYSYNDYGTDPSIDPIVRTLSEKEIILEYWDYCYDIMCKKFGKEYTDKIYTYQDCIDDWCVVHWAWEVH